MSWSADQYSRFEAERNRPIVDLLAHIPATPVTTAADIGCGPGNSTELLRARYPGAAITAMDSSADMIAAAARRLPDIRFAIDDIGAWADPGPYDVILANAALQWVPDHEALFPALIAKLAPGGSLAVQMPDNLAEPSHVLMREVARRGSWSRPLDRAWESWVNRHPADWYYRLLHGTAASLDIWRTTYHHPIAGGAAGVVEWFKGSALGPFLDLLDPDERPRFLADYEAALARAYPPLPDGTVLLAFPRLFVIATR